MFVKRRCPQILFMIFVSSLSRIIHVDVLSASSLSQNLPHGIQTIREIYKGNYIYVDQTGFLLQMLEHGKHYFIARPERSGKSLFMNTLEEIFKGNRLVFTRTEIYHSSYDWKTYPVLLFDFSQINSRTPGQFEKGLGLELREFAKANQIPITASGSSFQFQLKKLIQSVYEKYKTGVVILVDEYDNPIINHHKDKKLVEKNQEIVDDFFATLKSLDRYIHFTFVAGIDRSIITSLRGANYLKDISVDREYDMFLEFNKDKTKLQR